MKSGTSGAFGAQLKALREAAGFTQEELATIAGLSVHGVSALERGNRKRPQLDTVRALAAALDLTTDVKDALLLSARAPAAAPADKGGSVHLPLPPTELLGRDDDLRVVRGWWSDATARLITLTGAGGVGKTRLALEAARRIAAGGDARVVFVPLAAVHQASLVARAIAEALGLLDLTAADLPRRVRAACDGAPTLLVLDNCEQVLDAAPLVADLLKAAGALRILATSRAPLRIRGEREFTVGPLALPALEAEGAGGDVISAPAIRLFVDRVRDVVPQFRLTSSNGPVVSAICRRLDALPLALELAAPWLKVLTPENLLRRLTEDELLLTEGPRDLPERQRTMNATVAWSYQLLTPREQRVFRRLGALPERFPMEAVIAVVAGREGPVVPLDDLLIDTAGLVDKSLLLRADTSVASRPLYRMLETVRGYAAQELAASGERDDALDGLANYAVREGALATEGLVGPAQTEWLNRVRDDLESYRTALGWLIARQRADEAAGIVLGLFFFWVIRGHGREGVAWGERILELPQLSRSAESRALTAAGGLQFTQGDLERGRALLAHALTRTPEAGDADWMPLALLMLGHIEHARGDKAPARALLVRFLDESRRLESPWRIANALPALAWVAFTSGDLVETEALLEEVEPILPGTGAWFRMLPLYVRAILAVRRQNGAEAMTMVRHSLVLIKELHDTFAFVYSLVPLATAAIGIGDDLWAARILGARDAVAESTGADVVDPSVHELRQQMEREARARLGPRQWVRAYTAGRTASLDSLVKDIDARVRAASVRRSDMGNTISVTEPPR